MTAFYTPPVVIRAMYKGLSNLGFHTGNILEPSCGVGNFMGLLPENMGNSKMYGVELDSVSGRIAQQLYQKNNIAVQGFEKTDLPDSFFDVAIGNVPFGTFKVLDKKYDRYNFLIHDYFFARALDKVRPGGVVAFITSKGTMDKENPAVRKYIAQRADLLGAIRLPNDTFKAAAGTEVTSDILFLQKRSGMTDLEPDWVHLGTDENGLKMNAYAGLLPTENIRVETLALTLLSLFRSFPLILFQSQLCPLRELFGCQCPENVPPFKPGAVTGVQIHTETGRPPAVGTGPKTADAEFQLTGCQLILPPQHTRTDHHDFSIQVIVIGNGGTVLVRQRCHVDALRFGFQYLRTGFLGLF